MHIEVDKMGEKVGDGEKSRLASSECTVAVLKALSVLEGGYQLPQAGDSLCLIVVTYLAIILRTISTSLVVLAICGEVMLTLFPFMC